MIEAPCTGSPCSTNQSSYDSSFLRLASLQGSDLGFFVLAVHSFIEGVLRATFCLDDPADDRFSSFLNEFRDELIRRANGRFIGGLDTLNQLRNQHLLTNEVRHQFCPATVEDARAATQHLQRFCELACVPPSDTFSKLLDYLKAWDNKRCNGELLQELNELGFSLHIEKQNGRKRMERLAALEQIETEALHLKEAVHQKTRELRELTERADIKDAKVDELRRELYEKRSALRQELKVNQEKASELEDARGYIQLLTRMTVLTRTRVDYERNLIRLTAEQKQVLSQIRLDHDFLVKGAAGTGKTLVLLKAIEKAKGRGLGHSGNQDELGMEELKGSVALLTYTTTLVKYDQYIASLLMKEGTGGTVATADSFLRERLKELNLTKAIDYGLVEELAKTHPAAGLTSKELAAEIEDFIWGNDISYEEYVVEGIERRGMRRPLVKEQRMAIWKCRLVNGGGDGKAADIFPQSCRPAPGSGHCRGKGHCRNPYGHHLYR